MRAAARVLAAATAAVLLALALSGCETSAEKSAQLEKMAKKRAAATTKKAATGLSIKRPSRVVKIASTAVLASREGTAAVVIVRNTSGTAQREVPLAITVRDASGASLYSNSAPELAPSLTSIAYVPAHGEARWVDDQVQAAGTPTSVSAEAGEGSPAPGPAPRISTTHEAPSAEAAGLQLRGKVTNDTSAEQHELVLDAVSEHAGKIVAAGRAVLTHLPAHSSNSFEVLLIGSATAGAQVKLDVQPSS